MLLHLLERRQSTRGSGRARVGPRRRSDMRHGKGGSCAGEMWTNPRERDGRVLARLAACVARGVGLEGLQRE